MRALLYPPELWALFSSVIGTVPWTVAVLRVIFPLLYTLLLRTQPYDACSITFSSLPLLAVVSPPQFWVPFPPFGLLGAANSEFRKR